MAEKFRTRKDVAMLVCLPDRPYLDAWHESETGFGVRVMRATVKSGTVRRSYVARYTDEKGEKQKKTIGQFDQMAFDDASNKVRWLKQASKEERRSGVKPVPTLREVFEAYLTEKDEKLAPMTVFDYRKRFKYVLAYEDKPVTMLHQQFWQKFHDDLKAKSGRATAVGVCRLIKSLYQRLVDLEQHVEKNPFNGLKQRGIFKKVRSDKQAIEPHIFPLVWAYLHTSVHPAVRDLLVIAFLTGLRISVLGSLSWDNVRMDIGYYRVPAEQKGNKTKQLVWIPIPDYLLENVFKPRYATRGTNPWVIASNKRVGAPLKDVRGTLKTISAEVCVKIVPHDTRRTFATYAHNSLGNLLMVARLLTHTTGENSVQGNVTAGYVTAEEDLLKQASNKVALYILKRAKAAGTTFRTEPLVLPKEIEALID